MGEKQLGTHEETVINTVAVAATIYCKYILDDRCKKGIKLKKDTEIGDQCSGLKEGMIVGTAEMQTERDSGLSKKVGEDEGTTGGSLGGYRYGEATPYQQRMAHLPSVAFGDHLPGGHCHTCKRCSRLQCLESGTTSLQYRSNLMSRISRANAT